MEVIKFAKMHPDAKIPTKRNEDWGYDIYPAFDEDYIEIAPHHTVIIPTGLCSAFSSDYGIRLAERGSTGTKGLGQRSGIIDSGYRGEWMVPLTNHNPWKPIYISKLSPEDTLLSVVKEKFGQHYIVKKSGLSTDDLIVLPYNKAICQALLEPVPKSITEECTVEEIIAIESERGTGKLGSSGK